MAEGKGHPLPGSGEARHNEIPEGLAEEKGRGEDPAEVATPQPDGVNPDGEHYRYDDLGRGPPADRGIDAMVGGGSAADEFKQDQRAHQDRGQSAAEEEEEG